MEVVNAGPPKKKLGLGYWTPSSLAPQGRPALFSSLPSGCQEGFMLGEPSAEGQVFLS
jgi:hypothetical protein